MWRVHGSQLHVRNQASLGPVDAIAICPPTLCQTNKFQAKRTFIRTGRQIHLSDLRALSPMPSCGTEALRDQPANFRLLREVRMTVSSGVGLMAPPLPHGRKIAVIGLGYVGMPVAAAFARRGDRVIAFDIDPRRVAELKTGHDRTRELSREDLQLPHLNVTSDTLELRAADFFIVTVPTPIDDARRPDLRALLSASRTVGAALKRGDIVVYESTVFPGATEEECIPVLEHTSGLKSGSDFTVGYSPERINPGDHEHRFETVQKLVAAQDDRTLEVLAAVYGSVTSGGVHRTANIKTAEAAKVIENTQRDLNIALMNELSAIFHRLGIDTDDVLAAAATKWNFLRFSPGLVGGHCIGIDPYYLTHRAEQVGYHPEVILAGRRVNDSVGARVAQQCVRMLMNGKNGIEQSRVTILGLTFKEDVPDIRNSRVIDIIRELETFGILVQTHDPIAVNEEAASEYEITLLPREALQPAAAVILAVAHQSFIGEGWGLVTSLLENGTGIVLDVKSRLERQSRPAGIELWRL
jgi:UDP-N-acetyl-D-galactosamine dehydrogenase